MLVTPGSPGVEVVAPTFLLKRLTMLPLQTDIGPACVDLGRGVWTLRSDSRLPPGIIALVTLSLAVKATQTLLLPGSSGGTGTGRKGGRPHSTAPS